MGNQQVRCFVINLARSTDRLDDVKRQFSGQSVAFERIDAIDGAAMGAQALAAWYDPQQHMHYHKKLNPAEIACYLSHRKAWEIIIERELPFAVILEDDITITGDLQAVMADIATWPADWDYIKLAEHSRRRKVVLTEKIGAAERVTYQKIPARTCAQVVSLAGAKKLLAASKTICRPIDIDLQYWWEKDLRIFGYQPYPVLPNMDWESEIDKLAQRANSEHRIWLKARQKIAFIFNNNRYVAKRLRQLQSATTDISDLPGTESK